MTRWTYDSDEADDLRRQAASCRDLAKRARTDSGAAAFAAVSVHFDGLADRIDPAGARA